MEITLKPKLTAIILSIIVLLLTLAHIAGQFSTYYLGYDNIFGLIPMFNLNSEQNIPAFFSTLLLLFSSILLAMIASAVKKSRAAYFYHWLGLSLIFLFLSMDESLSFHESMTVPLRKALNTSGILFYAWVIPYGIAILILIFVYLKFFIRLPANTRNLLVLAAVLYIVGVIVVELMGGRIDEQIGRHNATYAVYSTIEEVLEMGGIIVFIYALMGYISTSFNDLRLRISS
jgi:hypothetical protein